MSQWLTFVVKIQIMSQCTLSLEKVTLWISLTKNYDVGRMGKYTPVELKQHKKQENDQWRLLKGYQQIRLESGV